MTDKPDLASSRLAGAEQAAHTPGPWIVSPVGVATVWRAPYLTNYGRVNQPIADCQDIGSLSSAEKLANARLIAAAPELLESLIDARKQLYGYEMDRTGEVYNDTRINAAIAKATGTEPTHRDAAPSNGQE